MTSEDIQKWYQTLEIEESASLAEIRKAYLHLKELYSSPSVVFTSLEDEFFDYKKVKILDEIEEAYQQLMQWKTTAGEAEPASRPKVPLDDQPLDSFAFNGASFKKIREARGIELHDLSLSTKISQQILKSIEADEYDRLPPDGYLRWHIQTLARSLEIDSQRTADEYLKRFRRWRKNTNRS